MTNGAALLDRLHGRHVHGDGTRAPRPDLVVLAPGLQQTEGCHVLAEMASTPALRDLPVILLGGSKEKRAALAYEAPAGPAFIDKPVGFIAFAGAVAQFPLLALRLVTTVGAPDGGANAA